jgi:hypothetical protein
VFVLTCFACRLISEVHFVGNILIYHMHLGLSSSILASNCTQVRTFCWAYHVMSHACGFSFFIIGLWVHSGVMHNLV